MPNDELENKIVDSEEFKRMKHLAGLEEDPDDWGEDSEGEEADDWDPEGDEEMEDFNAPKYIKLYNLISAISLLAVKSIEDQDEENACCACRIFTASRANTEQGSSYGIAINSREQQHRRICND